MALGKAFGLLIIIAVLMAVFFLVIRKRVIEDIMDGEEDRISANVSYLVCYLIYTFVVWGIVLVLWCGVLLLIR